MPESVADEMAGQCALQGVPVKGPTAGKVEQRTRARLGLLGFADRDAFTLGSVSGTARRPSQQGLASTGARRSAWRLASSDIQKAFLE